MASAMGMKADDWEIAPFLMRETTPENLSGVAFKFGSRSKQVAAQVSLLGAISGRRFHEKEDYRFVAVKLRNCTSKSFSIHDIHHLRGIVNMEDGSMYTNAFQKGSPILFFEAEFNMTGDLNNFVISGQWVLRKVLNYSQSFH
jgi:hypothetical protein